MAVVSSRYARALIQALPPDQAARGLDGLRRVQAVLEQQPAARELLLNPAVPAHQRERFIRDVSQVLGLAPAVEKLLMLLVDRRRLGILAELIESYRSISDERNGIVRALVTTAAPLPDSDQTELQRRLEASTGKRVVMELEEDSGIIGGLVVRIGSRVFDGSIRQHLEGFKSRLLTG